MPEAEKQAGFRARGLSERGWRVEYSPSALEEILQAALQGLLAFPYGGLEVGGVLYGAVEDGVVRVLTSRPVVCEHAFGPGYTLSEKDEEGLRDLLENSREEALAGLVPVGWYHTHTRSGMTLGAPDVEIHNRHFPEAWQFAMLLLPHYSKPTQVGIFLREPDGSLPQEPSCQLEAGLVSVTRPAARDEEPAPEAVPGASEPETPAVAEPAPVSLPGFLAEPRRPSRKRLWGALAAVAVLAGAGFLTPGLWRRGSSPPPLALRLAEQDGRLEIHWDAGAPAVRQARWGWLEVQDGPAKVVFALDAKGLQEGVWSLARQSSDVAVRLRVQAPGAAAIEESARFLGSPPEAVAPPQAPAPRATLPAAPREEIGKLRAELDSQLAESARLEAKLKTLQRGSRPEPPVAAAPKPAPRRVFTAPRMATRTAQTEVPRPPEIGAGPPASAGAPLQPDRLADAPPPPPPVEAAKPAPAYRGPKSGTLIWTGFLPEYGLLTIDRGRPSAGHLTGGLPPVPCRVGASPAEFTGGGLTVYSADPRLARGPETEPAGPRNGWNRTTYRYDLRLARDVVVAEAPGPQNAWSRLVLRSGERPVSVILLEWEIIP